MVFVFLLTKVAAHTVFWLAVTVEYLTVKCQPNEFTVVFIIAVYVHSSAKANDAPKELHDNRAHLKKKKAPRSSLYDCCASILIRSTWQTFYQSLISMSLLSPEEWSSFIENIQMDRGLIELSIVSFLFFSDHIFIMLVPAYRPFLIVRTPTT